MASDAQANSPKARNDYLDITRGIAVLGILVMNIISFGLPKAAYYNPVVDGADQGTGLIAYALAALFAEGTMRALFSILFGASICMLGDKLAPLQYIRRYCLLALIGVADVVLLLWTGDVLYDYALVGMLLYFLRNVSPTKLLAACLTLLLIMATVQAKWAADLRSADDSRRQQHAGLVAYLQPDQETLSREQKMRELPYLSQVRRALAPREIWKHFVSGFVTGRLWDTLVAMLLGMWLYRMKLLGQKRLSPRLLWRSALLLGACGLAVNGIELWRLLQSGFAPQWLFPSFMPSYQAGRFCMALAYLALFALWLQSNWLQRPLGWLASAGRVALSNYLLQSLIGLLLFTQGLALYNTLTRSELLLLLLLIWPAQMALSHWWLKHWRFGPIEWAWRYASTGKRP